MTATRVTSVTEHVGLVEVTVHGHHNGDDMDYDEAANYASRVEAAIVDAAEDERLRPAPVAVVDGPPF